MQTKGLFNRGAGGLGDVQKQQPLLAIEGHGSALAAAGQSIANHGVVLRQELLEGVVGGVLDVEHQAAQLRFVLEAADYLGMGLVPHPAPFQQHVVNAESAVVNLAEVAAVDLEKTSIEVTAAGGEPTLHAAGVEDEVSVWVAVDQLLVQQSAFRQDVFTWLAMFRHVDEVEKGVAAGIVSAEVDAAVAAQVAKDRQHQLVPVPVNAADAGLLEGGGEASGAAAVEADYVDAPGGVQFRCVDAHRFTDRYRFGHRG